MFNGPKNEEEHISKREYLAMHLLAGMIANNYREMYAGDEFQWINRAFNMADLFVQKGEKTDI